MSVALGMASPDFDNQVKVTGDVASRRIYLDKGFNDGDGWAQITAALKAQVMPVVSVKVGRWATTQSSDMASFLSRIGQAADGTHIQPAVALHHEPIASQTNPTVGDAGTPAEYAAMMATFCGLARSGFAGKVHAGPIMNGYAFSTGRMGSGDAVLAQWLPDSLLAVADFVAADTYGTERETVAFRMGCLRAYLQRRGYTGSWGIGEFGCLTTADLQATLDLVQGDPKCLFADEFNSPRNTRDGRNWVLSGDMLTAFKAALATSVPAWRVSLTSDPAPQPDPRIAELEQQLADMTSDRDAQKSTALALRGALTSVQQTATTALG